MAIIAFKLSTMVGENFEISMSEMQNIDENVFCVWAKKSHDCHDTNLFPRHSQVSQAPEHPAFPLVYVGGR